MRPNYSVLSLAKSCKSPLGAFFTKALLLGLSLCSTGAQTRLNSTQVESLSGAAQGPFASTILRDYNSALDAGNGGTNSVASSIVRCGVTVSCSIIIPPSYATVEAIPGYGLNYATPTPAATTSGNITIVDRRYGDARMSVNFAGYLSGLQSTPSGWLYSYYSKANPNAYLSPLHVAQNSLDGGNNQQSAALNYADKTSWTTVSNNDISHTPGQHLSLLVEAQTTSIGDMTGLKNSVTCYGGFTTEGDLGCHAMDNIVAQGNVEYSGALTGSPATAATTLSVVPVQGASTQGAGRFLVKINAGTITGGTITQIANAYNSYATITGLGTVWPVSTVIAALGTNVASPGAMAVTPSTFTAGSMAGIQTSSLVCVADQESFEMVYPTAVTATTFTANFAKPHLNSAAIAVGGLCGYLLDLTADDVTNATYPAKSQTITGTLHFAWPMIASPSSTTAYLWVTGDGGYQQIVTRWDPTAANGYLLYPFAEVTSTQQAGGISNTLTVGPNDVAWTSGDTVSEFLYPSFHATFGNTLIESYTPNVSAADEFSLTYNMPLQGNDAMFTLSNNGPLAFYHSQGGRYDPPAGFHVIGPITRGLTIDLPGDTSSVSVGCASPCTSQPGIIAAGNASYYDFLSYDESGQTWNLSENSNSGRYSLAAGRLSVPFTNNTYLANDSSSNGYIATQQLRSNASANSDLAGELVFTNASSASQSLQGAYASHPECQALSQFDIGSGNRHWISYAASSFTINFATPVSGTVSYSCAARN